MTTNYPRQILRIYEIDKILHDEDLAVAKILKASLTVEGSKLLPITETRVYQGDNYFKHADSLAHIRRAQFQRMAARERELLEDELLDLLDSVGEELLSQLEIQHDESWGQAVRDEGYCSCVCFSSSCDCDYQYESFEGEINNYTLFGNAVDYVAAVTGELRSDIIENFKYDMEEIWEEYKEEYQEELDKLYAQIGGAFFPGWGEKVREDIEDHISELESTIKYIGSDEYVEELYIDEPEAKWLYNNYVDAYLDCELEKQKECAEIVHETNSVLLDIRHAINMLKNEFSLVSVNHAINVEHHNGNMIENLTYSWGCERRDSQGRRIYHTSSYLEELFNLLSEGDFDAAGSLLDEMETPQQEPALCS